MGPQRAEPDSPHWQETEPRRRWLDQPAFNRNRLNAEKLIDSMILEQLDRVQSDAGCSSVWLLLGYRKTGHIVPESPVSLSAVRAVALICRFNIRVPAIMLNRAGHCSSAGASQDQRYGREAHKHPHGGLLFVATGGMPFRSFLNHLWGGYLGNSAS